MVVSAGNQGHWHLKGLGGDMRWAWEGWSETTGIELGGGTVRGRKAGRKTLESHPVLVPPSTYQRRWSGCLLGSFISTPPVILITHTHTHSFIRVSLALFLETPWNCVFNSFLFLNKDWQNNDLCAHCVFFFLFKIYLKVRTSEIGR